MTKKSSRFILIDSDVISHFIRAGQITKLTTIFDTPIKILDIVYAELERWRGKQQEIENLIAFKILEIIPFTQKDENIGKEFFFIKKYRYYGDGEAACMSYAKFSKDVIASNNLKDTKNYCDLHGVDYLTTMDFLIRAMEKGLMSEIECDEFINKNITGKRNPFPVTKIKDFSARDISHIE